MTAEEEMKLVKQHAVRLGEHFQHVVILCSNVTNEGFTNMRVCTRGNYYAQSGMAGTFLSRRDELDRQDVRDD